MATELEDNPFAQELVDVIEKVIKLNPKLPKLKFGAIQIREFTNPNAMTKGN